MSSLIRACRVRSRVRSGPGGISARVAEEEEEEVGDIPPHLVVEGGTRASLRQKVGLPFSDLIPSSAQSDASIE